MIALAGYENFLQIHHSVDSQVYRARRIRDRQPVILKFLNREYPTPEQIRRYKQEYYLTYQLDAPGIIKAYRLEEWQRSYAIALEDFGGISLQKWLQEREKLSLEEFLEIAIFTAESLAQIHARNIIHKDINPANLIFNPQTKDLKIIDFGISTQLNRENPTLKNPNVLEGTLAYISPEQTGRMNRGLDYRTDFYSLGVTFYELLTEKLPFATEDPLELVHCHIAKTPRSPAEIELSIPAIVSQIVMKLMAKNAEDRYQSADGLKADLEKCHQQLESTGKIEFFALACQDISDRFQIPQKLYGREAEISTLLAAFERITETGNVKLMLVSGYSGIGKSALVQELYKPITASRGYFISGKFDQFQRNIPYSAIVAAFRGLIVQLLGESEIQLNIWREKLLKVLGHNGQIIIDVIPEVELIIGKQPPVPILGANETQNRFNLAIGNFIRAFCEREHPLTLFLDDLQWADLGTLKLLERLLIEGTIRYLLLLGAYRDNEVSLSHPLTISIVKVREKQPHAIAKISLTSLPEEQIINLISDTLQEIPENVRDIANLILQKTQGNPFFINEFLQALYRENLLQFNPQLKRWQWNMVEIEARDFTDNVVELMVEKLKELPIPSQEILSFAACWGVEFDLTLMTWIKKISPQDTFQLLKGAINIGSILPLSEPDENLLIHFYKFGHDRIQQAAYSLVPEHLRESTHTTIGKLVLANTTVEEQEEKIFDIVSQMNHGINSILTSESEKEELIELNIKAGKKAKEATAYDAAIYHFNIAIELLLDNCWEERYELTLFLHEKAAEVAYMNGDFAAMELHCQTVLDNVKSTLDKINIYEIIIQSAIAKNQGLVAVKTALDVLNELGEKIELYPDLADTEGIIEKTKQALIGKNILSLLDLPFNQNPQQLAIIKTLTNVHSATFHAAPQLIPIEISIRTMICLQYGNSEESAHTYADYGLLLCGVLGDIETGYIFGQLALAIAEKFPLSGIQARAKVVTYFGVAHWKKSLRSLFLPFKQAYQEAIDSGDSEFAGYSLFFYCASSFLAGVELSEVLQETDYYSQVIAQIHQEASCCWNRIYHQTVINLLEAVEEPWILAGESYNEYEAIVQHRAAGEFLGVFIAQTNKLLLAYLFENYEIAYECANSAKQYVANVTALPIQPYFFFYDSLLHLEFYANHQAKEQKLFFDRINENQEKMKVWGNCCPKNYLHKYHLVEARKCQVLGQYLEAMELYDLAIAEAKQNEYLQEEALANELAAKFYLDWGFDSVRPNGKEKFARLYLKEAHYCYQRWGAISKVRQLERKYSQFLDFSQEWVSLFSSNRHSILNTRTTSTVESSTILDLTSVIKATRAISSEIVLDRLLAALMEILVENAGAQRGVLLLPAGDRLNVEATKESEFAEVSASQSIPLEDFSLISARIIHYVARTRETVFLHNANKEGNFTDDPYIQQYQCRSIACIPLSNQSKLKGIIYLENNLITGAFTRDRLQLLQMLAAQAAISLENARLYENLQTLNMSYERFIPSQFLSFLEKKSIVDVELGDQVEREMTVLFSDIRDFTTISEQMTPAENFAFINGYLGRMEPLIQQYGGFIDKYIGDAIMALFGNTPDDALQAAIAMLEALKTYNLHRQQSDRIPLRIGIGLHTGRLMLGTVGGADRMDGTAIGDSVNLSSRVEGLTKTYGISLLITQQTFLGLNNPFEYDFRFIERVTAKGKAKAVSLFEIFSSDSPALREAKNASKGLFEKGAILFHQQAFNEAAGLFQQCLEYHPSDRAARSYLERCQVVL